jgi:hypothetical protein
MSVNALQAYGPNTRFTKKGNSYEKTNISKLVGTGAGATMGAVSFAKSKDVINSIYETAADSLKEILEPEQVSRIIKESKVASAAIIVAGTALTGLALGAVVDFAINKVKAFKADKNAEAKVDKIA